MPFYFDFDYLVSPHEAILNIDHAKNNSETANYSITLQEFEKFCPLIHSLENYTGSIHLKNERLIELLGILKRIMADPPNLFKIKMPKKVKEHNLSHAL